jgi:hypothetical protein
MACDAWIAVLATPISLGCHEKSASGKWISLTDFLKDAIKKSVSASHQP